MGGARLHAEGGGNLGQQRGQTFDRLGEFVRDRCGRAGDGDLCANRREGRRFENRDPAVGEGVGGEVRRGGLGQTATKIDGEDGAGLGRLTGQLQRPNDATDPEVGLDVRQPVLVFLFGARDQARLHLGDQFATGLGSFDDGIVGRGDDAAKVAQVELRQIALGGFGTIEPVGDAQPGEKILGHLQNALLGHGGLALGGESGVGLFQALTNGLHSLQREFGDRTLVLGDFGQNRLAVGVVGAQTLGLGALGQLGRRLETGATRSALATFRIIRSGIAARSTFATFTALSAITTFTAITTIATISAIAAIATSFASELLGDRLEGLVLANERDGLDLGHLHATLHDADDGHAIDVGFGFDLDDVTGLGTARQDGSIENSLGFTGTSGAPGPGSVGARTGQLDVDAAGHGWAHYRAIRALNQGTPLRCACADLRLGGPGPVDSSRCLRASRRGHHRVGEHRCRKFRVAVCRVAWRRR